MAYILPLFSCTWCPHSPQLAKVLGNVHPRQHIVTGIRYEASVDFRHHFIIKRQAIPSHWDAFYRQLYRIIYCLFLLSAPVEIKKTLNCCVPVVCVSASNSWLMSRSLWLCVRVISTRLVIWPRQTKLSLSFTLTLSLSHSHTSSLVLCNQFSVKPFDHFSTQVGSRSPPTVICYLSSLDTDIFNKCLTNSFSSLRYWSTSESKWCLYKSSFLLFVQL